eukprot:s1483_g18.t1
MEPNPFWSDRQPAEHQLQALRPADLPVRTPDQDLPPVPADEWEPGVRAEGDEETPQPVEDGRPRERLGGAERDGRRSRASAYTEWSSNTFQTPPSSWQTEGAIPRRPTGVLRSQGTVPTGAEPELPERGGGEPIENVQSPEKEMDTTEGNLRDNRRVNFWDTAMGLKGPDGTVQDSNQGKDKRKTKGDEALEKALGEQMYQEAVLEKEKIAKENELLHAEIQRLRAAASSASTTSSWVEVDKAPSTPKRGSSAAPKHTPGGTRILIGPPPEDDEVFVTFALPPVPPFPEFEEAHAGGGGWGVMWKPVPKATELGPAWPKRLFTDGQMFDLILTVFNIASKLHIKRSTNVIKVLGSMSMSLKTSLMMQGNDMSLWDRIAMFHGWAKRHQRGLDVVQELHERPGIAGLPVLDWMPHHAQPASGQHGGDRAGIRDHLRSDRASTQEHQRGDRASTHGQCGGDRAGTSVHLGGDRAGIPGQHGGDRASTSGQLSGDRAGTQGHLGGDRVSQDVNINNYETWDGDQYRSQRADYGQRDDGLGRDQRRRSRSPQEALRSTNPTMPKLPAPSSKNASVEVTDWLAEIRPLIGDLSTTLNLREALKQSWQPKTELPALF